jgi:hypothetical protein
MSKRPEKNKPDKPEMVTVAYRIRKDLREFYEQLAANERRDLSDVLRIVTEDQAEAIRRRDGKLMAA